MCQMCQATQTFDPARHVGEGGTPDSLFAIVREGVDAAASVNTVYSMDVGDTFVGTLGAGGDRDWVAVTLEAGTQYRITLDGVTLSDPYLRLYDASGTLVGFNDDSNFPANLNSELVFTAQSTGTFYVAAGAFADSRTGSYEMSVAAAGTGPGPGPAPVGSYNDLADFLTTGFWTGLGGQARRFDTSFSNQITVNISALPREAQELARAAFEAWEAVANIRFVEVAGTAQISFDDSDPGLSAYAQTFTSGGFITSVNVMITSGWLGRFGTTIDSYSFQTYVHEIGHALGLGHQGSYDGSATYGQDETFANDSWQLSVMSYFDQNQNTTTNASRAGVITAMMADIIAIQNLYGAPGAGSATAGDTIWGGRWSTMTGYLGDLFRQIGTGTVDPALYGGQDVALTLYDQGGVDIIDLSASTTHDRVNLNGGTFSDVGGLIGNMGIAVGTVIENLNTGSGNDTVTGNGMANRIFTANGNDSVNGGNGYDTLSGGGGNDTLHGDDGNDRIWGGGGNDSLTGGNGDDVMGGIDGNDTLSGGDGNDELWGGNGEDTLYGDNDNDLIGSGQDNDMAYGGAGNDTVLGGGGVDYVYGENGDDLVNGDGGVDFVSGGDGNDTVDGGGNDDAVYGGAGNDIAMGGEGNDTVLGGAGNDTVQGNDGADVLFGENGIDVLDGGQGWDRLAGGGGNDILTGGTQGDTFVFYGDSNGSFSFGTDRITDFNLAEFDRLALDDALWGGAVLTQQQVIDRFGSFNSNGDLVLAFTADNIILLEGVNSTAGLAGAIDII